jgi:chromosome segregation ATPase
MRLSSHYSVRILLVLAVALILSACNSKSSQCSKLSSAINKIRPIAGQFQQEGKNFETAAKAAGAKNDLKAFKAAAASSAKGFDDLTEQMDGLIQEIQTLDLKDETLINLQRRYVENAKTINEAFKETSTALTTISQIDNSPQGLKDLQQAAGTLTQTAGKMNTLVQEEGKMVTDFNNYCGEKKGG